MTRAEILAEAARLTTMDREDSHGDPHESFRRTALVWSGICGHSITPQQVPLMMAGLKAVRAGMGSQNDDDTIDGAGYFALAGEN